MDMGFRFLESPSNSAPGGICVIFITDRFLKITSPTPQEGTQGENIDLLLQAYMIHVFGLIPVR